MLSKMVSSVLQKLIKQNKTDLHTCALEYLLYIFRYSGRCCPLWVGASNVLVHSPGNQGNNIAVRLLYLLYSRSFYPKQHDYFQRQ